MTEYDELRCPECDKLLGKWDRALRLAEGLLLWCKRCRAEVRPVAKPPSGIVK